MWMGEVDNFRHVVKVARPHTVRMGRPGLGPGAAVSAIGNVHLIFANHENPIL